jgi:hypothetical protein
MSAFAKLMIEKSLMIFKEEIHEAFPKTFDEPVIRDAGPQLVLDSFSFTRQPRLTIILA